MMGMTTAQLRAERVSTYDGRVWTRLVAAVAALAAVFSVWWMIGHDDSRSLGVVFVFIIAEPPSVAIDASHQSGVDNGSSGVVDATFLGDEACSRLSAATPTTNSLVWEAMVQADGVRGCRLEKTWRIADLLADPLPGEPHAALVDGLVTISLDPALVPSEMDLSSLRMKATFPGEVVSHSGSSTVTGSTVSWADPLDFSPSYPASATGRDRPLMIGALPWLAGLLTLVSLIASLPWRKGVTRLDSTEPVDLTRDLDQPSVPESSSTRAQGQVHGAWRDKDILVESRPTGPDPDSPWRPPSE